MRNDNTRSVYQNSILSALILGCFALTSHGQVARKFRASLGQYDIHLTIDTGKWRRVTYEEMAIRYRQHNMNFDDYLQEQKAIALFIFVPKDSIEINDQTSITITIDSTNSSRPARDTIESNKTFLQNLRGGMKNKTDHGPPYFDKTTNSLISKNSVIIVKRGEGISEANKVAYLIVQKKEISRKWVTIEYRCFTWDEEQYFPQFQKIIASFR